MSTSRDFKSILVPRLIRHEGLRLKPYRDAAGKLTIGIGRNLTDVGISMAEAMVLLANDVDAAATALDREQPWWTTLDQVRREALVELVFNMGPATLRQFKQFLAALETGAFDVAASALLDSAWANEVGGRAAELATMIRTGGAS